MKYLNSSIRDLNQLFVKKEDEGLIEKVTPLVAKIKKALFMPIEFPKNLVDQRNFWIIAAYPDVVDHFYPSFEYGVEDIEKEKERVENQRKTVDSQYDDFEKKTISKYGENISFENFLLAMKDYYKENTGKKFLLQK